MKIVIRKMTEVEVTAGNEIRCETVDRIFIKPYLLVKGTLGHLCLEKDTNIHVKDYIFCYIILILVNTYTERAILYD
jgi:hypothetical protein